MALSLSGTSNGSLNNLSLTSNTGTILDSANTTFFGVDMWRLTTTLNAPIPDSTVITNLERVDDASYGKVGTGMTESSGVFTFPSTGIYLVQFNGFGMIASGGDNVGMEIKVTTNNSSYSTVAYNYCGNQGSKSFSVSGNSLIDVTDTANVKVSFSAVSIASGSYFNGDTTGTSNNETYFTFIRLGDT